MKNLFILAALAALAWFGYSKYWAEPTSITASRVAVTRATDASQAPAMGAPGQAFQCDGRTMCSQMTSCAEATYFLQHCPNTRMDGNNDGEPCERQWCN